jgi:poly-gamma-glutamate synthesis protein (capsule biosynthesis protein)
VPGLPIALAALLAALSGADAPRGRVTLAAVGDIQLGLTVRRAADLPEGGPFALVREALDADLTLGNLEGVVPPPDAEEVADAHGPALRQPPEVGRLLREAGFDVVSLANNHLLDFGVAAVAETLDVLREADVSAAGAWPDPRDRFHPVIRTAGGATVGFLAYTMWLNVAGGFRAVGVGNFREDDPAVEVAALRPYVDFLVVLVHWERENDHFTYGGTRQAAHAMVDAGADVVVGHHAHVLKGIEWYRGAVIAYSLGNFAFGWQRWPQAASAVLRVTLARDGSGRRRIADARVVPVVLGGPRSVPVVAQGARAARVLGLLQGLAGPLGTRLSADGSLAPKHPDDAVDLAPRLQGLLPE